MRRGRKDYFRSHGYLVKLYFAVNDFYYAHFGTELLHLKTYFQSPVPSNFAYIPISLLVL